MAGIQNLRTSFRGFNRKDVVGYIEYLNNKHNQQVEQLNNQLQAALANSSSAQLQEQLKVAQERIAELETALEKQTAANVSSTEQELEAYRRAERAERQANERAQQIYTQANAVLADATLKAEAVSESIAQAADNVTARLSEYQQSVQDSKAALQDAVAVLYAIRPEGEESL